MIGDHTGACYRPSRRPTVATVAVVVAAVAVVVATGWAIISLESLTLFVGVILASVTVIGFLTLAAQRSGFAGIVVLGLALLDNPLGALFDRGSQVVGYLDDISLALLLVMVVLRPSVASTMPRVAWAGFGLFAGAGLVGAVVSDVNLAALPLGAWLAVKLPLTILVMSRLTWTPRAVRGLLGFVVAVFAINALVSMVELVDPQLVRSIFGVTRGETGRLGLTSIQGIFGHPVQAATFMLFVMAVMLGAPVPKRIQWFGYAAAGLAALGLRAKTIIDIFVILALRIVFRRRILIRALAPLLVFVMGIAILGVSADLLFSRVEAVLQSDASARANLLSTATQISSDYFPLGSGFGTFGSEASRAIYSPLWQEYGLSNTWGFQRGAALFATDASWATVLAESGLVGALGLAVALVAIWVAQFHSSRAGGDRSWALAALMFTSIVALDSLASPRLFDGFASASLAVLLALAAQERRIVEHPSVPSGEPISRRIGI